MDNGLLLFSSLSRFQLVVGRKKPVKIYDYTIHITESPYPPVSSILIEIDRRKMLCLPWEKIQNMNQVQGLIWVPSLEGAEEVDTDWIRKAVLLKRDILDAMMLDLLERIPVMANDLGLQELEGKLSLTSVDIGFGAILRRISGGFIDRRPDHHLHDWRYIEFLRGKPEAAQSGLEYHGLITRLPPGEIAFLANSLPYLYVAELLTLLPDPLAADTLEMIHLTLQREAFEELDPEKAIHLLTLMRPDIVADLLSELDPLEARSWLEKLPRPQADRILQLMQYPSQTAGGMMTNDIVTIPANTLVKDAIKILKDQLSTPAFTFFIQTIYVVDSELKRRLQGAFTLRDLLVAGGELPVSEIMYPYLITLLPTDEARIAARRVIESGLPAIPVIGDEGRILGVITIDTALGTLLPEKSRRPALRLYT